MTVFRSRLARPALHQCVQSGVFDGYENDQSIAVSQIELTDGLKELTNPSEWARSTNLIAPALVLVRLHSQPLGIVALDLHDENAEEHFPQVVRACAGDEIARHSDFDGDSAWSDAELWGGRSTHGAESPRCSEDRVRAREAAPYVSVIVATRDRMVSLGRCVDSLLHLDYPHFEIVIVDNDPSSDETKNLVENRYGQDSRVLYVREGHRGLSSAHNAGLRIASGSIIAFTDDDVIVDEQWLSDLVVPFVVDDRVAGSTGLILPAELETTAQIMLELHGNFSKGFSPRNYDLDENRPDDPLYPFRAGTLGSGANMAFSASYLREIGGFDPALGAGTRAKGGDDLAALCRLILSGRRLSYRPGAIVWHHHHRDISALEQQAYGYGVGFSAYLTSVLVHNPRAALSYLRHLPTGIAELLHPRTREETVLEALLTSVGNVPSWPRALTRLQRHGMASGPMAYLSSRSENRPAARSSHDPIDG